ncbi:sulfotransferase family protein [Thioclava indica]|uniref:Sulfotransferase n=1 Tax=Thioclava indica TaxID=1353528 RepID=A0A074KE91_9RHOB|nr:sulfotransferase [Thioclava indica]KEO59882.1 hypothetical protein DT23_15575 [Thioclava indica]
MTKNTPLMIVGAPRSGNTLVRRVLMASGQIYIPPETYVLGELIENWRRAALLSWRDKVWLFCAYFDRHPHRNDMDIASLSPFADTAARWPRAQRNLRALLDGFYRFMAGEHGYTQARWGDKTPWNTVHLKSITRFYPDAQYLHLLRDGRDSVASQVRADMRDIDEAARRWISANEMCERHLRKVSHLQMRYEDIVRDPETSFARVFDWAGLRFESRFLTEVPARMGDVTLRTHHANVLEPITPRSIGGWTRSLDAAQVSALPAPFHAMMTKYGYG